MKPPVFIGEGVFFKHFLRPRQELLDRINSSEDLTGPMVNAEVGGQQKRHQILGVEAKIHAFYIGVLNHSIIFTIHFGGIYPYCWKHPKNWIQDIYQVIQAVTILYILFTS